MKIELDKQHSWDEAHTQRMKHSEWADILLNNRDTITFKGRIRRLVADDLGYGIVAVYKERVEI